MSCTLAATFNGYIHTTYDALIVFEACLSGELKYVPRRLTEDERRGLIRSGNVFIYNEHKSGMKRWTDGVSWSPSRILDNFLVYRELQDHKGKPKKRKQMANGAIKRLNTTNKDWPLIGSLVDSYDFKQEGLVKKTISITLWKESYHLVCYYKCEDIKNRLYTTPSQHHTLKSILPRTELMAQKFRVPVDSRTSANGTDDHLHGQTSMDYGYNHTVIQHEAIPMDYHPGLIGLHYTHQQPQLAYMQLQQYEEQQSEMPYYLPDYSEEQQEAS
ncbi:Global transcription regulator sge1 [Fusarium falciforme]|nr:Global transcription regulator sge1 [Fusarium falciforme]